MDLLKYEFIEAPSGSYNFTLKELVKNIRHYRNNVPAEEFKAVIPKLQQMERQLQNFDAEIGEEERFYIHEIMEELDKEAEIPQTVIEESERLSIVIAGELFGNDFSMDEFQFEIKHSRAAMWMEFNGYRNKRPDSTLLILKDVFRSVCYKYDIVFIDFS